jgi:hypothetical protein
VLAKLISWPLRLLRAIGHEIAETIRFGALRIDAAGARQHDPDAVVGVLGELRAQDDGKGAGRQDRQPTD